MVAGVCAYLRRPGRLIRAAIVLEPSTLVRGHRALVQRKYHLLFSSTVRTTLGPKGPHPDGIAAVVAMKQRNPTWGCPRIVQQIAVAFGIVMAGCRGACWPRAICPAQEQGRPGARPSGTRKDRLWSLDLFGCESATWRTHWVLVVMDHWTRRIVGCGAHRGVVDWAALCRLFNCATRGQSLPRDLSADHDPRYRFHQAYRWPPHCRGLYHTPMAA
jgi:hypothetical protein